MTEVEIVNLCYNYSVQIENYVRMKYLYLIEEIDLKYYANEVNMILKFRGEYLKKPLLTQFAREDITHYSRKTFPIRSKIHVEDRTDVIEIKCGIG